MTTQQETKAVALVWRVTEVVVITFLNRKHFFAISLRAHRIREANASRMVGSSSTIHTFDYTVQCLNSLNL